MDMKDQYIESVQALERLHRLFLDVLKLELDYENYYDINNVQALILYNIGESQLSVGELTNRGYYLGSNVSYNLRKMVQNEYVIQIPSPHDRRSSHIHLSEKGLKLFKKLDEIFKKHTDDINSKGGDETIRIMGDTLQKLERFWNGVLAREGR